MHGAHGKCTCRSFVHDDENGEIESSDSLNRSVDFGQQNYGSTNDLNSSSIQPFNNNPSLPNTQRFDQSVIRLKI